MEALESVREQWYQAYLQADIERLKSIECLGFIVVSEQGIEFNDIRYARIEKAKQDGRWFEADSHKEDLNLTCSYHKEACHISGAGQILDAKKIVKKVEFNEFWFFHQNKWQIKSLHLSPSVDAAA